MDDVAIHTAAIYARVSTADQADHGYSLPSQISESRVYCEARGWRVVIEEKEDLSGATPLEDRPGLMRIMEKVIAGEIDAFVVYAVDRLGRERFVTIQILAYLESFKVKVFYVQGGYERDEFLETLMIGWAAKERRIIVERLMRGRTTKARMGLVVGSGRMPYGYRYDGEGKLLVCDEEAEVVRWIFEWYAEEWISLREIADRLTQRQVKTYTGNTEWATSTVQKILYNEAYTGRVYYNRLQMVQKKPQRLRPRPEEEWIPVQVPPIIDPETWELASYRLEYNRETTRKRPCGDYLLRGILVCAECERAYSGELSRGTRRYRDGGRQHPSLPADLVEERIWSAIKEILLHPSILWASHDNRSDEVRQSQDRLRAQLEIVLSNLERARAKVDNLLDTYLDQDMQMSKETYLRKKADFEEEIAGWEKRSAELQARIEQVAITAEQMASVEEFSRKVSQGIDHVGFAGKREILEKLRTRGLVYHDEEGAWVELSGLFPTCQVGLLSTTS